MKIQSVLASIIVFTASYSIAYSLTDTGGGTISFNLEKYSIISSVFDLNDILLLLIVSLMICLVIAFIIRTKFGSLLLAMTASKNFLKYRHRYKNIILILTVGLGNGIVGLAGAFHALRDKSASVIGHSDFLPIILGALFGGNAITLWFTNKLHKNRIDDDELSKSTKSPSKLLRFIASVFSFQREDSKKIGMLFFTYVIGSFFLKEIHGIVHSKAFIDISFNLSHLIIALLIVFSVWWAGVEEE